MTAHTLAYENREIGRFLAPPDRIGAGKTTRDVALSFFAGASDSSGKSSMGGTPNADWMCDANAIGFEGHHIMRCKFTSAPELSTKPIPKDIYKKLPAAVTMKL